MKQVETEIKSELFILNKGRGKDIIRRKENARKKLLTEQDLNEILSSTNDFIKMVLVEMRNRKHLSYSRKQVFKVRDALIAVATVRLGRRSLEMTRMTLSEVDDAQETAINNKTHHLIKVLEQKNSITGKPAPVVYDESEFEVLKFYIKDLRKRISPSSQNQFVFPSYEKLNSRVDQGMTLSGAYKVLQKCNGESGKNFSSRTIRGSKITVSRSKNPSDSEKNHLANSMSHSRSTADSYYDYSVIENSVVKVLSKSLPSTSAVPTTSAVPSTFAVPSTSAVPCTSAVSRVISSTPVKDLIGDINMSIDSCLSSTGKRKIFQNSDSDTEDSDSNSASYRSVEDETLLDLRSKKIKTSHFTERDLKNEIRDIIGKMSMASTLHLLHSKSGIVSVITVRSELAPRFKTVPTKHLRSLITEILGEIEERD